MTPDFTGLQGLAKHGFHNFRQVQWTLAERVSYHMEATPSYASFFVACLSTSVLRSRTFTLTPNFLTRFHTIHVLENLSTQVLFAYPMCTGKLVVS